MYAAILHDVRDAAGGLSSALDRRPYAEVEATQYLDGRTVYHGTIAGTVLGEEPNFYVDAGDESPSLHTETEETPHPVVTDILVDLDTGWAGVDSSDGAELIEPVLIEQTGAIPERTEIKLNAIVETLPSNAIIDGVVTSEDTDDGDPRDAAAARWHDEAPRSATAVPNRGLSQVNVSYHWDGRPIQASLAASGYVALYSDVPEETAARWISEVVWPNTVHGADAETAGGGE